MKASRKVTFFCIGGVVLFLSFITLFSFYWNLPFNSLVMNYHFKEYPQARFVNSSQWHDVPELLPLLNYYRKHNNNAGHPAEYSTDGAIIEISYPGLKMAMNENQVHFHLFVELLECKISTQKTAQDIDKLLYSYTLRLLTKKTKNGSPQHQN